jgi:tetratricopeptide (TPR) repeat protein
MRALVLAGCVLMSYPAFACSNGMREEDTSPTPDLMARRANLKLQQRDYPAAMKAANTVLKDNDASAAIKRQARRTLGIAQLRMALYKEAHENLTAALLESPDEPSVIARLGETEEALGQHAEAKGRLEALRAKGMLPDPEAHIALARALFALGEVDGARSELNEALSQEPDNAAALALKAKMDKAKKADPKPVTAPRS